MNEKDSCMRRERCSTSVLSFIIGDSLKSESKPPSSGDRERVNKSHSGLDTGTSTRVEKTSPTEHICAYKLLQTLVNYNTNKLDDCNEVI